MEGLRKEGKVSDGISSEGIFTLSTMRNLLARRDKIARHWIGRVAPLGFFSARHGTLHFHDLAVAIVLEDSRTQRSRSRSLGAGRGRRRWS
jgi:hypothetical protein